MGIKETLQEYYRCFEKKQDWEDFFTEDVAFTVFTSPGRQTQGKALMLKGVQNFLASVRSMEVRDLIIEGNKACGLVHYEMQTPQGSAFPSDVAEIFTFKNGKFDSFGIYFDNSPYPKR